MKPQNRKDKSNRHRKLHQKLGSGLIIVLLLLGIPLSAQNLDEEELRSSIGETVSFENYTGPVSVFNTAAQIRDIGTQLSSSRAYGNKYNITRYEAATGEVLRGADVLEISSAASVDHVDNIRRILIGYLESEFAYTRSDAETLSFFITIYNAVHRGNMEFFSSKYSANVMANVNQNKIGLALSYKEWPGNTQIIIPLALDAGDGELSSVPADELASDEVIEVTRDQEDMALEERMELADLIDRTVDEEQDQIDQAQEDLTQEQDALDQRSDELAAEEDAIREEIGPDGPTDEQQQQLDEISQEQADIATRQDEISDQQADLSAREQQNQQAEETSRDLREQTSSDVSSQIEAKETVAQPNPVLLGKARVDNGQLVSTLVILELNENETLFDANQIDIWNRSYVSTQRGILVNKKTASQGSLALLSESDLSVLAESTAEVSPYSPLIDDKSSSSIFAIVSDSGSWYIGRFDYELNLLARSSIPVDQSSAIVIDGSSIIVQRQDGRFSVLTKEDLKVGN